MNFFRTTYTLCTKISALNLLKEVSLWRALLHTFLLLIICSVATASCTLWLESEKIDSAVENINTETGGFYIRGNRVLTKNNVTERHFVFDLHSTPLRLDYFNTQESIDRADLNQWDARLGLAVTPTKIYLWNSDGRKEYFSAGILEPALLSVEAMDPDSVKTMNSKAENKVFTGEEFHAELKETVSAAKEAKAEAEGNEFLCDLGLVIKFMLWLMVGIFTANEIFLLAILAALVLPPIEMLRMRSLPNKLPYSKLIMLTLYATFPGFIAASIFESFASHVLSFQTVFFIVFIVYQMLSFGKLILDLNPQLQDRSRSDDMDDDDF